MESIEKILDRCKSEGADSAEVYRLNQKSLSLSVREGKLETIEKSTPGGLAIRFFKNGKNGFAHTTDFSDRSVNELIRKTKDMAAKTESSDFAILPGPGQYGRKLELFDDSRADVPIDDKIGYLMTLEKLALEYDVLVDKSNGAWYTETISDVDLLNSNGVRSTYNSSSYEVGISVIASKNGSMYPGDGSVSARYFDDLPNPEGIVDRYVSRAVRLVGGSPVSGGDYEIIFAPDVAYSFFWGLGFALNGENVLTGTSFLAGKKDESIAGEKVNLYDDALMLRGIASRPSDDEGVPSRKNKLIDKGVLTGFLYDTRTAARAGTESTGSAVREDYNANPEIFPSNLYMAPGGDRADDVVGSCRKGIIVEAVRGWGLDGVTGQYSAGINGILVRNGKRIRPVANVTVAASPEDLFKGIEAVCDDITYFHKVNMPTVMVKKMKVGA